MKSQTNKSRLFEIDLLRFIAAIAVVLYHYTFAGHAENLELMPATFPILSGYTRYAYLGVHLFFMISGFVVLLSAMNRSAIAFTRSRFIRIFPAFWAAVSITALVIYFFGKSYLNVNLFQYLSNLTLVSGYLGVKPVDGVYWTLLIELVFYFLIFTLLWFKKIEFIELFLGVWLSIIVLSLFIEMPSIINFFFFPEWAPLFIGGSLLYLVYARGWDNTRLFLLFAAYLLSLYFSIVEVTELAENYSLPFSSMVPVVVITVFYIFFLLLIANKTGVLRSSKFISLGLLSYPLYLLHANLGYLVFNYFSGTVDKYLLLFSTILLMLILAGLVHYFLEKPLADFLYRKTQYTKTNPATIISYFRDKYV